MSSEVPWCKAISLEQVRYGKLRFEKHIEPRALDVLVRSIMLQPLVENCIKHGLSGEVDGGTGLSRERLTTMMGSGIGVNNVSERLKVFFGRPRGAAHRERRRAGDAG